MSNYFMPEKRGKGLELIAEGGDIMVHSLRVTKLESAWTR
jgi:hypothetical protein